MKHVIMAVFAGVVGLMLLGATAWADDVFDGSVEIINEGQIPIVAVIDGGSRGEGANVKPWPSIANRLGLRVEAGKADTIARCFRVGDEITVHVYVVENGEPTRELSSKKFPSVILGLPPDITRNFHIVWDGSRLTKQ